MNILNKMGEAITESIKKNMAELADRYDSAPVDMYAEPCDNAIKRINTIYAELKGDKPLLRLETTIMEAMGNKINRYEIYSGDILLKANKNMPVIYSYLTGMLNILEPMRAKVNVCKKCGAVFDKNLTYCPAPHCRTKNWHKERKVAKKKKRVKKIKEDNTQLDYHNKEAEE